MLKISFGFVLYELYYYPHAKTSILTKSKKSPVKLGDLLIRGILPYKTIFKAGTTPPFEL